MRVLRAVLAVIAGFLVWTALWIGGNAVFFGAAARAIESGEPYTAVGPLLGVLVLSLACSLVAGFLAATLAGEGARVAVLLMAALLLLVGLAAQAGVWPLLPLWYHLSFLALIVPVSVLGGRLTGRSASS